MLEVAKNSAEAFYGSKVGEEVSVLFEHRKNGLFVGLTPDYAEVRVKAERDISNTVLPVRIISADGENCLGELVNNGGNDLG